MRTYPTSESASGCRSKNSRSAPLRFFDPSFALRFFSLAFLVLPSQLRLDTTLVLPISALDATAQRFEVLLDLVVGRSKLDGVSRESRRVHRDGLRNLRRPAFAFRLDALRLAVFLLAPHFSGTARHACTRRGRLLTGELLVRVQPGE